MIEYRIRPPLTSEELDVLFANVWQDHQPTDHARVASHSLTYVCAYAAGALVGYVNVAWDGGEHAFLLDTAVHKQFRRQGIGTELVTRAVEQARSSGMKWIHVDFEPHLASFYHDCGFRATEAGLIRLND
jgi:GNAT superfamily N-acetyltransferase